MPPNKATDGRQAGQALPVGLALLVCAVLLLGLCFRLGNRMLQQERVRMRSDLTAYSGGVLLARSLNVLCYSEKLRMAGELVGDIPFPITKAIGNAVEKGAGGFQKFFLQAAPWLIEGDVVMVGNANELAAVPLWNQPDALGGMSLSRMKPDLRVSSSQKGSDQGSSSTSSSDKGAQGGGGMNMDLGPFKGLFEDDAAGSQDEGAYHYRSTQDGQRHDLGADEAEAVEERGPKGGSVTRYKDKRTHKYVAKDRQKKQDGQGLTDQGGHYLAVLAIQTADENQATQRPGLSLGCSQVRVAGGNVNAWDFEHGADYAPFFVPVRNASDSQRNDASQTLRKGLAMLKRLGLDSGGLAGMLQSADQALAVQH